MTNPTSGIKVATDIAQNQYVFGILFILLLVVLLWGIKMQFNKMEKENINMEEKNDAVIEKIEKLHEERQKQLNDMMIENKAESKERENQLMAHNNILLVQLQSQNASLEEITRTQEKMQENLGKIEQRIEKVESNFKN